MQYIKVGIRCCNHRFYSVLSKDALLIGGKEFAQDSQTNVTPKILSHVGRNLFCKNHHPLSLLREKIVDYFYRSFIGRTGSPIFAVADNLHPVVSLQSNFDSLLVPPDHVSRSKADCYYVNKQHLLRSHMTAHQVELLQMGLDNFIMVGDVYRRDEIDASHYPVFHQLDCVRLYPHLELMVNETDEQQPVSILRTNSFRTNRTQEVYTEEASIAVEAELKKTLEGLCQHLFGPSCVYQWVDAYFPFTHPSWELEIKLNDQWVEVLGCGIMENNILKNGGCEDRIGWAFGLGLERLAMILYNITDIRLFWSNDSGFLSQFDGKSYNDVINFSPVSVFPQCINDISFWVPAGYVDNDFYELARDVGGDIVEQIQLVDVFSNSKTGLTSHCYRIIYRHMEKTLTKEEVNSVHQNIAQEAAKSLKVKIR